MSNKSITVKRKRKETKAKKQGHHYMRKMNAKGQSN